MSEDRNSLTGEGKVGAQHNHDILCTRQVQSMIAPQVTEQFKWVDFVICLIQELQADGHLPGKITPPCATPSIHLATSSCGK